MLSRQKKYPRLFYRNSVCKINLVKFLLSSSLAPSWAESAFLRKNRPGIPRGAVVAGMKCHSFPWSPKTCTEVPVYLLNMPLITVRMCCVCWLKLRENKSTLHLQSFLRSFQDHQKSRIVKGWAGFGWGRLKIWGLCISFLTEHMQELFCIPLPSLKPLKSFCPTDPFEKVWHMADVNHLQVVKPQIHQLIIQFQILLLNEVYTSFELILHLKRRFTTKYSPSRRCGSRLWEKAKFPKLCLLSYH